MANLSDIWSDSAGEDDATRLVTLGDNNEVLGADFHPDRLADSIIILPDNGQLEDEQLGSGWYLTDDGFSQTPPEGVEDD